MGKRNRILIEHITNLLDDGGLDLQRLDCERNGPLPCWCMGKESRIGHVAPVSDSANDFRSGSSPLLGAMHTEADLLGPMTNQPDDPFTMATDFSSKVSPNRSYTCFTSFYRFFDGEYFLGVVDTLSVTRDYLVVPFYCRLNLSFTITALHDLSLYTFSPSGGRTSEWQLLLWGCPPRSTSWLTDCDGSGQLWQCVTDDDWVQERNDFDVFF